MDSMSIREIEAKARELRQLQQLIEEAQAEAEAIKDQIKAHMGEADELRAGEYRTVYTDARITSVLPVSIPVGGTVGQHLVFRTEHTVVVLVIHK